ncbi:MAG TPA: hypothetical protein VE992_02110, partial [Solirubrobacteraceae bacterium]|nr:hypothetical protein [Solirubrobacteraceae bacterium]
SFVISGGPSWKPLPFCFTTLWGLFGGAAPTLWVITARAGGLLGLVAAYRLGARLVAPVAASPAGGALRAWRWAAPLAGLAAAGGVILTQDAGGAENWTYYMFRGTSEPMLIGAVLWSIDRHLAGRRGSAFVLLLAASLIRPEAWPFIFLYGVWLWLREPGLRALVLAGWLAIPFLWFVPPWVGSGDPFLAASHAKAYNGHLGADRFVAVLGRGVNAQLLPALILGLVAVALAWWRRRDRIVAGLGACALAWWVIVVGMTLDGYPGLQRFYLPAAALTCVLAAVGIVELAGAAAVGVARLRGRGSSGGGLVPGLAAGLALALVVVCGVLGSGRISAAWGQRATASRAVTRLDELSRAVAALGGHRGVYPCRTSFAAVNHGVQTALAWKLHVTLGRVGTSMRHQGLDFVGPHDAIDGGPAPISRHLTERRLIARVGVWRIYRVTAPGADTRCVGR